MPCRRLLKTKDELVIAKERAPEVRVHKIWDFLTTNPLTDAELAMTLPVPTGHRIASQIFEASWAITMYKLLVAHPQGFADQPHRLRHSHLSEAHGRGLIPSFHAG